MKSTVIFLALILVILANFCFAGQGWYLSINNDLSYEIILKHHSSKCWYENDLGRDQVVRPYTEASFYSEERNSGLCLSTEHYLELKVSLVDGYTGMIKLSAPFALSRRQSQIQVNDEIKERDLGHREYGTQVPYSIRASDLCLKDRATYLSCILE